MARVGWLLVLAAAAGCARAGGFACSEDAECGAGQCEPATGFCSFADEECPTGWKYGAHAGSGLAGQCVDPTGESAGTATGPDLDGDTANVDDGVATSSSPTDDGDATTTTASADSGMQDTSAPTCASGTVCRPAAPPGWEGPAVVVDDTAIPSCPAAAPTTLELAHTDIVSAPAECSCGCNAQQGSCPGLQAQIDTTTGVCGSGVALDLTEDECITVPIPDGATFATVAFDGVAEGGSCSPSSTARVSVPSWGTHVRACEDRAAMACDPDGTCLPPQEGARVCIVRDGEVPCPAGEYSERTIVHGDYDDTRACSSCSCTSSGEVCRVEVRSGTKCAGTPDLIWPIDGDACGDLFDLSSTPDFTVELDTTDMCQGVGGQPTGEVTPIDPITMCCVPA